MIFNLRRMNSNWSKLTSIHQQKLRFPVRTPQVEVVRYLFQQQKEFSDTIKKIFSNSRTMKTSLSNCWNSFQRNKAAVPYATLTVRRHPVEVTKLFSELQEWLGRENWKQRTSKEKDLRNWWKWIIMDKTQSGEV